jgi:hypothetical protein
MSKRKSFNMASIYESLQLNLSFKANMKIANFFQPGPTNVIDLSEGYLNFLILLHGQNTKDLFRFKRFHFNFIIFFSVHKLRTVYKLPDGSKGKELKKLHYKILELLK